MNTSTNNAKYDFVAQGFLYGKKRWEGKSERDRKFAMLKPQYFNSIRWRGIDGAFAALAQKVGSTETAARLINEWNSHGLGPQKRS